MTSYRVQKDPLRIRTTGLPGRASTPFAASMHSTSASIRGTLPLIRSSLLCASPPT